VSDDDMLTRDLEAEVLDPAWTTKVRLGPQELTGAPGRMSMTAVGRIGVLGALGRSREWPSALYDGRVCDLAAIR
jgi:hypothetical protein